MNKSNLGVIIIVGLLLIGLSFYGGYSIGNNKAISQFQREKNQEMSTMEISTVEKLLSSKVIQWRPITNGTVKKTLDHSLNIVGFSETGKEIGDLIIPISKDAEIVSMYVLPEGAPEEQIMGGISTREGKVVNLGNKEIDFGAIKKGDQVCIDLELKPDFTVEGVSVTVWPANLLLFE